MGTFTYGIYELSDNLSATQRNKLPTSLQLDDRSSAEAALLRLLVGKIYYKRVSETSKKVQKVDYTCLPFKKVSSLTYRTFEQVFGTDITTEEAIRVCDKYFLHNRKNIAIHELLLSEITWYFYEEKNSPISAFVHLYRCLEFMSYSFPMIYASKTKDYMGSFQSLKKFLSGDSSGELVFFRKFLVELFKNERTTLAYVFEMEVTSSEIDEIKSECKEIFEPEFAYEFEDSVFKVSFNNMLSMFIILRNRYFHMLVGQGQKNFKSCNYDINDIFRAFNPHFLNWIAIIFSRIVQQGFYSST